jgi:hypothetical protein
MIFAGVRYGKTAFVSACVAQKLRGLADAIEAGNITRLEFQWDGSEKIHLRILPRGYPKNIVTTVGIEIEDP